MVTLIAALGVLALAQATNPREQLQEYADQLRRAPNDDALRTRLIQLALTIDPKPATPDAAIEAAGKGKYLLDHAASATDFAAGAAAFAQASLLAPWVPDYYFNQGILLEKAERYQEGIKAFRWYLAAAPYASDRADVLARVGGLQAAAENSAHQAAIQAEAERQRAAAAAAELARKAREEADPVRRLLSSLNLSGGYRSFACSPGKIRRGDGVISLRLIQGCNEAEYSGRNWWESSFSVALPDFSGRLTIEDGQIKVYWWGGTTGQPYDIGTPTGPSVTDIRWESIDIRTGTRSLEWGRLSPDGSSLIVSKDRPVDDGSFNSRAKYHYDMLKRE